MQRDPALLPGPTAQQWETRARFVLAAGGLLLLIDVVLLSARAPVHPSILIALGVVALAGFVGWIVLGAFSQRRQREEMRAGYSTTVDAAGYDLRHPVTGALERDRTVPPDAPGEAPLVPDGQLPHQAGHVDGAPQRPRGRIAAAGRT